LKKKQKRFKTNELD